MKGKRFVSEKQTVRVTKYSYVKDEPEGQVVQNIKVNEAKQPGSGPLGVFKRKKKVNPTQRAEEFADVMRR